MQKLFKILVIVGLIFFVVPKFNSVQAAWRSSSFGRAYDACDDNDEVNSDCYIDRTTTSNMVSLYCKITPSLDFCTEKPERLQSMIKNSAIGQLSSLMGKLYANPPADLALWVRDTGTTLGFLPKQAMAQGIGFSGLAPLLPIWKAFRNIAYLLLAIVMVVIGFMVMLRKKIDPKTVVTVQNALPKIVITLLLITFSYAIVGLMIDMMYLVILLFAAILVPVSGGALGPETGAKYIGGGFWSLMASVFGGGFSAWDDLVRMISGPGVGFWGTTAEVITGATLGIVIALVLAIALLFGFVRIIIMLVSAYIQIIIALITAPLQLLVEAFPGSTGFASWIKNLFANLAMFPITAIMLMIGTMLTRFEGVGGNAAGKLWTPPLLTSGGGNSGLAGLIGLGVILTIPTIANAIKEGLKAKPAVQAGPGAIVGPIAGGVGQLMQFGYQASFVSSAFRRGGHEKDDLAKAREAFEKPGSVVK